MNSLSLQPIGKKILFSLIAALFLSFSVNAQRIATVDTKKILESIPAYQKAQKSLDDVAAKWRREINEEYDKIKGMYNKYQAESVLMSDEVRTQKEEEIMNKEKEVRELQKAKFGPDGALFKKRQELVRPIQDKVFNAIEDFADVKGYDVIFDKSGSSGIVFSNARFDKTEDIIKRIENE